MNRINPRLVWCDTCKKWSVAPANDANVCQICKKVSSKCRCTRCGKEWTPKNPICDGHPVRCYVCNSPYYDRAPFKDNAKRRVKD